MDVQLVKRLLLDYSHRGDWEILTETRGKPYAVDAQGAPGPCFSLSHTKGHEISLYAVSKVPLGVDIERWADRDFNTLADYAFGPRERQEIRQHGLPAFYRIWTAREALSKVHGEGMTLLMDGTDRADGLQDGLQERDGFHIFYSSALPGHSLALAYAGNVGLDEIKVHLHAH